ncbi:MAG: ATP-binding protein [Clostridiales bacterium]|nr:ATP-binding protein [Clostridiales bacterium]
MIIGRKQEIKKLKDLYESNTAELVALYGRRRVGKTFLIDEVFEDKITFRHSGLSPIEAEQSEDYDGKSRMRDQLKHFCRSLKDAGMKNVKIPDSWLDAFYMLEDYLAEKNDGKSRVLIFIDEIQWLDTPRSGFMTGLEAFWNGWACHKRNIMMIVCGSSSSWVLDKLINNHGGLYDRVTCEMRLSPFSLKECEEYFHSRDFVISRYDIVQAYMMAGGIPYYLQYFNREKSLAQNVDAVFFAKDAPLKYEFDRLFNSLFVNPDAMKRIVCALNTRSAGFTRRELIKVSGEKDGGEFSRFLEALISGGFVIRYISFGSGKRDELFKLADPFCIFYLKYVKDNIGKRIRWTNLESTSSVITWRGLAFENVCFNHIDQIKSALGISDVSTEESFWSRRGDEDKRGAQIDLIIKRKDNVVNMCEIKFLSNLFTVNKDYHFVLDDRRTMLIPMIPKKAVVHSTLITTYGLKQNEYYGDFVKVVLMDDLFAF